MHPILTIEFKAKTLDAEIEEESVTVHNPEELFAFIAPNGGCDNIPDEVGEIRFVFLPPEHKNADNPVADTPAMLQLHQVLFSGPLAEISQIAEQIQDKAGRGELSAGFLRMVGCTE
jgi:hypothetical protein